MKLIQLLMRIDGDFSDPFAVIDKFDSALVKAGCHIRRKDTELFPGQGVTRVVYLNESHAILSTWPEHGFAMIDYFSCAEDPHFGDFVKSFEKNGYKTSNIQIINRGD